MSDESKYILLFGFEKKNDFHTGFLKVGKPGDKPFYTIVHDESDATQFFDAGKIMTFFDNEPELENWSFHPVIRFKQKEKTDE